MTKTTTKTKVQVNYSTPKTSILSIDQLQPDNWYQVFAYPHNIKLIGEIGIAIQVYNSDVNKYEIRVITPTGFTLSHQDLKFIQIKRI